MLCSINQEYITSTSRIAPMMVGLPCRNHERPRGLKVADLDERVTFLRPNFSQPRLGLEEKTYEPLCDRFGLVIHHAWPVNFNLRLTAFRPQLAGMINPFQLCTRASLGHTPASFVFISSVSAVGTGGLAGESRPAHEQIATLDAAPSTNGEARSKFLSEVLCQAAAQHLAVPVTVARVGQVAGAVRQPGCKWNRKPGSSSLVLLLGLYQWVAFPAAWAPSSQRLTGFQWIC